MTHLPGGTSKVEGGGEEPTNLTQRKCFIVECRNKGYHVVRESIPLQYALKVVMRDLMADDLKVQGQNAHRLPI